MPHPTRRRPGDVVGIKVNPVGNPLANTSTEVLLETIKGLRSAGIPPKDIVVFERWFLVPLPKGPLERLLGF